MKKTLRVLYFDYRSLVFDLPRQCIVFAAKADASALSAVRVFGNKSCLKSNSVPSHLETLLLQVVGQEVVSLELAITQLGIIVYLYV